MRYFEVHKPYMSKNEIEAIKTQLKSEGWQLMDTHHWEVYMPSVIVYDYNHGEEVVYFGNGGYKRFIEDKYNEDVTLRRKVTARRFIFDRLTK